MTSWMPPAIDPDKNLRDWITGYAHRRFVHSQNPMFAWEAYRAARDLGDAPPEWVLQYLDDAAGKFWSEFLGYAVSGGPNTPERCFAQAFGISAPGKTGRGTIWSRFCELTIGTPGNWKLLGSTVAWILRDWRQRDDGAPQKEMAAIEEAVRRYNIEHRPTVSRSTVWRAWARYQREFPDRALS